MPPEAVFAADLPVFFGGVFATAALLDGVPVTGILDRNVEVLRAGELGVAGLASTFTLASASAGAHPEDKPLAIVGQPDLPTFRVDEARPDGLGCTVLILRRGD